METLFKINGEMYAKLNIGKYIKASQTPERLAGRAHGHDQSHQRVPERQLLPSRPRSLLAHSGGAGVERMVPATPAQFQFSHARSSPARQRFHLRASRHLSPAVCQHFTFVPGTPEAEPPSTPERRGSREAPGAFSRPQARTGAGRGVENGAVPRLSGSQAPWQPHPPAAQ